MYTKHSLQLLVYNHVSSHLIFRYINLRNPWLNTGYRCNSDMPLFKWKFTWNYAYSPFNTKVLTSGYVWYLNKRANFLFLLFKLKKKFNPFDEISNETPLKNNLSDKMRNFIWVKNTGWSRVSFKSPRNNAFCWFLK